MPKNRFMAYAFVAVVLIGGSAFRYFSSRESPIERAYRECQLCGIGAAEVDQWIDDCRHSTLDRDGLLALFEATGGERDREACRPCVQAVIEAGGIEPE